MQTMILLEVSLSLQFLKRLQGRKNQRRPLPKKNSLKLRRLQENKSQKLRRLQGNKSLKQRISPQSKNLKFKRLQKNKMLKTKRRQEIKVSQLNPKKLLGNNEMFFRSLYCRHLFF